MPTQSHPRAIANHRRALALAVHVALASLPLYTSAATTSQQQVQHYDIASGPLGAVLSRYAQAAGVSISFSSQQVGSLSSQGLKGSYSVGEGFARILQGSGLTVQAGVDGYVLVAAGPAGSVELGATNVNSTGLGASTEGTGSYTTGSVSIGKLPTSIKDTPQSVSVITRQRIEDQHLSSMDDVLNQTTGISAYQGSTQASRYLSRGFVITNFRVDGGAPVNSDTLAWRDMDMAIYDHVEILRGADGIYSGNGEPGGSINLVRKRPTAHNQILVTQSAGTWDNYRTELDVSGPLGMDGGLRGRSVVVSQDRNSYVDQFEVDRQLFHTVIEADITDSTMFTLGYTQERFKSSEQAYGLPRYSSGGDLDLSRSTYLGAQDDYKKRRSDNIYARLEQHLNDDWVAALDVSYAKSRHQREYYNFNGAINPLTYMGSNARWQYNDAEFRDRSLDASLKGGFNLLGGRHEAVLGYTWQSYKGVSDNYVWRSGDLVSAGNIFSFDPDNYVSHRDDSYLNRVLPVHVKQSGFYGSLRLQLADPLHLVVGGRYNDYYTSAIYNNYNAAGVNSSNFSYISSDKRVFTPFVALTYSLNDEWTAYSSVADIYLSQASSLKGPAPGTSPLEPIRGRAYELGMKGELFGGRLNTTTALYYTKREGEAVRDLNYPLNDAADGATCCYLANGEVVSKGVEFEVSGQISERLEGTFGYTYNHNVSSSGASGARALNMTPKHLAKAFLTYRLPEPLDNLRVGGGASAQSVNYVEEGNLKYSQSGYALFNAFADYRLNDHWSVALNGNNLADKKYYATLGNTYYGNFYGDPRNFMLTLRGSY